MRNILSSQGHKLLRTSVGRSTTELPRVPRSSVVEHPTGERKVIGSTSQRKVEVLKGSGIEATEYHIQCGFKSY